MAQHICSFLARTVLSVCTSLSPVSLFCTSLFCLFSFSLRPTRDLTHWPYAVTRVVGGWDPGDWGYCWAVAPQCQHITLARTSARREVRKARPDQSVGGTSLGGVFHQGFLTPEYILFIALMSHRWISHEKLTSPCWTQWGVDKMKTKNDKRTGLWTLTAEYRQELWTGLVFFWWSQEMMHCQSPSYHHLPLT